MAVAVAGSRRLLDLAWVTLAAAGVVLLTGGDTGHLNVAGIVFAAGSFALAATAAGHGNGNEGGEAEEDGLVETHLEECSSMV